MTPTESNCQGSKQLLNYQNINYLNMAKGNNLLGKKREVREEDSDVSDY